MSTMQQSPTNILTWILNEIQENKDDYITIVCKVNKNNIKSYFNIDLTTSTIAKKKYKERVDNH